MPSSSRAALSVDVEPRPAVPPRPDPRSKARTATTRRRCAASRPSRPATSYNEKRLLDYQERLLKVGLFEGASVELDATGPPEAAPVRRQGEGAVAAPGDVRRRLQRQHRAARLARALRPQGVRPAVDRAHHAHLRPRPEVARHRAHRRTRDENLWRNLAAANVEQLRSRRRDAQQLDACASAARKDTTDFERLYYLEAVARARARARR